MGEGRGQLFHTPTFIVLRLFMLKWFCSNQWREVIVINFCLLYSLKLLGLIRVLTLFLLEHKSDMFVFHSLIILVEISKCSYLMIQGNNVDGWFNFSWFSDGGRIVDEASDFSYHCLLIFLGRYTLLKNINI